VNGDFTAPRHNTTSPFTSLTCHDQKQRIVSNAAEQLWNDYFAIDYDISLVTLVHIHHSSNFLHPCDDLLSDTEADNKNLLVNPEQPPVRTYLDDTLHLNNHLAGKRNRYERLNILENELYLLSPLVSENVELLVD